MSVCLQIGVSRAMSALRPFTMENQLRSVPPVGMNPGKAKLFKTYAEIRSNVRF